MKKLYLILLALLMPILAQAQNPVNKYKWIKTTQDTISLGLAGDKAITIKNCGTSTTDSLLVYIPFTDGTFSGYPFAIGRQTSNTFNFYGSRFIVKSKSDSVMMNYQTGSVNTNWTAVYDFNLVKAFYTDPDTSGIFRTTIDSVTVTGTWFKVISFTQDSTLFISFDRTFPLHYTFQLVTGSLMSEQFDMSLAASGKIYYRKQTRKYFFQVDMH